MTSQKLVYSGSDNGLLPDDASRDLNQCWLIMLNPCWLIICEVLWHSLTKDIPISPLRARCGVSVVSSLEWVSEWMIKFNGLSRTADSEVHVVHVSHVIIACTLESLYSLTYITHNLQATINFKKKGLKKNKSEGTHYNCWLAIRYCNSTSVYNSPYT